MIESMCNSTRISFIINDVVRDLPGGHSRGSLEEDEPPKAGNEGGETGTTCGPHLHTQMPSSHRTPSI